jgi:hypothetical protein
MVLPRRPLTRLAAALIAVAGLAGCSAPGGLPSTVASTASEQVPSPDQAATPDQTATPAAVTTPDAGLPAVVATPEVSPAPETSPQPTLPALSAAQQEKFGGCLTTAVTHWSSGACAALAQETLAGIGFLAGEPAKRIDVRGANAILNYQRSRGIDATGTIDEATWRALATNQSPRSTALPAECLVAGTVLCVDQGARTLRYVVDGTVERTVQVRLGGFAQHAKKKNWRNFPTANGTYTVYDKQRNPRSENYGAGAMPYSIMFHPDMYVHYSSGFAKQGYDSSSHGCVNVGDKDAILWLYEHTPIGATVHVF